MSWASDFHFTVEPKPKTEVFAPSGGWNKAIDPVSPWTAGAIATQQPAYQTDEKLKKQYGIELAKASNPFEAAKTLLGENDKAVWASFNWMADPIVIASRDAYLKTLELATPPLDREQLAAKVLALAEGEKVLTERGSWVPTIEAKERINAYKLYSEILGYTGKVEIDNSTKNTINNNKIELVLVRAADKPPLVIDNAPNVKSEMQNAVPSPISLKLVKAR